MANEKILVVDDEKNIRMTISYALEPAGYEVDTAANGEEALEQLEGKRHDLILLDLRMPGMDGIEVLRRVVEHYPHTRVAIITAHGTVTNAVEAMKLGAIDFIQKPFTPQEIRDLAADVLARAEIGEQRESLDYETQLRLVKHLASRRELETAKQYARQAIGADPSRPQAFNLLGALHEIDGNQSEAMKNYRVALDLDPTYQPAHHNLNRPTVHGRVQTPPNLG